MRIPRTVTAAAALLLLSACVPNGVDATSPAPPTPAATSPADLAALRQQYGLPDRPTTDPEAEQLDGDRHPYRPCLQPLGPVEPQAGRPAGRPSSTLMLARAPDMADVDRVIHEPARLRILTILSGVDVADFNFLLMALGLTKGNLSSHMDKLEKSGYVDIKGFNGRIPH